MKPEELQALLNGSESKVSMKIESNSKGSNYTVHCYAGVTVEEINECIKRTVQARIKLQEKHEAVLAGEEIDL